MSPPAFADSSSSTGPGASPPQHANVSGGGLSGLAPPSLMSSPASCGRAQLTSPQNNYTNGNMSGLSNSSSPNRPCCQSSPGNARMTSSPGGVQVTSPPPFVDTSGSSGTGYARMTPSPGGVQNTSPPPLVDTSGSSGAGYAPSPSCCMNSTSGSEGLYVSIPNASAIMAEMSNLTDSESCYGPTPPRPRTPAPSPFNRQPTLPAPNLSMQSPPFDPAAYRFRGVVTSGGQMQSVPQGGYNGTEESYGLLNRDITLEGTFEQMPNDPNIPAYQSYRPQFGDEGMDQNWNYSQQPGPSGFPLNIPNRERCPTPSQGNDPYLAQSTPRPMPDRYRQPSYRYVNASPIGPPTPPGRLNYSGYSFLNDNSLLQGANISNWEDPARLQNNPNLSRNIPLTYSPPPRPETFPAEYMMETPPPGAPRPYNVQFAPSTPASPDVRLGSFFRTPSPQRPQSAPCPRVPSPAPISPQGYLRSPPANLNSAVGPSPPQQMPQSPAGSGGVLGMSSPSFVDSPSSVGQGASPQQPVNVSGGGLANVTPPDFGSSSSASSGSPQRPANASGCGLENATPPNFESSSASSGSPQQPLNGSGGGLANTTPCNLSSSSASSGSPQQPLNVSGGGLANVTPPSFGSSASSGSPQQRGNVSGGGLANVTPPSFGSSASSGSPQQPPPNAVGTGGTPGDSSGSSNSTTYTYAPDDTFGSDASREVLRADRSGANSVPCSSAAAYANRMQNGGLPRASPGGGGPPNSPRAVGPGGPPGRASNIGGSFHAGAAIPSPARERSIVSNASSGPRFHVPSALDILGSCFELVLKRLMFGSMIPVVDDLMKMGLWPWKFCNCPAPQNRISNLMAPQPRGSIVLAGHAGVSNVMSPQAGPNDAVGDPAAQSTPNRGPIVLRPNHDQGYRGDFSFLDNPSMPQFDFVPESQIMMQRQLMRSPGNNGAQRPCSFQQEPHSMGAPERNDIPRLAPPGPMHRSIVNAEALFSQLPEVSSLDETSQLSSWPSDARSLLNAVRNAQQRSLECSSGPVNRSMVNAEGMNSSQQRPCCGSAARSPMGVAGQSRALVPWNPYPFGMNMAQGNQNYLRQGGSPAPGLPPVSPPGACSQNIQRQQAADISGWSSFNRTGNPNNPDFDSSSYY